jgi:hypothetical protein
MSTDDKIRWSLSALGWFSVACVLLFGGLALGFCVQSGACMTGSGSYGSVCIGIFNASAPICDEGSLAIMGLIATLGGLATPVCIVLVEAVVVLLFMRKSKSDYRQRHRFRILLIYLVAIVTIGILWGIFWISIWINVLFAGLYIGSLYAGLVIGGAVILFYDDDGEKT